MRIFSTTRTLTMASCHFLTTARAAARSSSARTAGCPHRTSSDAATTITCLVTSPPTLFLPTGLQLDEERTDAAADLEHHGRRLRCRDALHGPLHRGDIRHR